MLPNNLFDVGITSPPYNKLENKNGKLVKNVLYDNISDNLPEDEYQHQQIKVLNELFRVIKPGGSFFYNHKIRWEKGVMLHPLSWINKSKWSIRQEIIWNRQIAANIRGWRFWQVEERIYWLYKPIGDDLIGNKLLSKHAKHTSIWTIPPERNNPHPAPFPLAIPLRAIYSVLDNKKGLVIDPYAGSGTSLVAAKLLGHDYLGIEQSEKYVDMAKERLLNFEFERDLCNQELATHVLNCYKGKSRIILMPKILLNHYKENLFDTSQNPVMANCLKTA